MVINAVVSALCAKLGDDSALITSIDAQYINGTDTWEVHAFFGHGDDEVERAFEIDDTTAIVVEVKPEIVEDAAD